MKQKSNYNRLLLLWGGELVSPNGGGLTSFGLVYILNCMKTGGAKRYMFKEGKRVRAL